jgi:hypothetical protein
MTSRGSQQHDSHEVPTILSQAGRQSSGAILLACLMVVAGCIEDDASGARTTNGGGAGGIGGFTHGGGAGGGLVYRGGGSTGEGGTGRGGAGGVTGAGGHSPDAGPAKDPAAVQSPGDCAYDGSRGIGGGDAIQCHSITVDLNPPLAAGESIALSTNLQPEGTIVGCVAAEPNQPCFFTDPGDPTRKSTVVLLKAARSIGYPTTLTVRVSRAAATVAQKTFPDLRYRCIPRTFDDWCWEADPVTFSWGP